jgi:formylglycine-generating enzyme required for sulfatase activity
MKIKLNSLFAACFTLLAVNLLYAQDATFTNSIGMEFKLIQPGSFVIGKFQPPYPKPPDDTAKAGAIPDGSDYNAEEYKLAEKLAKQDARPGFTVTIKQPFYIGKFEVTQAQWKKAMSSNPSVFQGSKVEDNADDHPVENVTWEDAQQFLNALNKMEKGRAYRLPTEFEWEYAARAGATADIPWGQIRKSAQMGMRTTAIVGGKEPNAWGLYDMLGNVWEWVQDIYNDKLFADKVPPAKRAVHVLKGASFIGDVKNATYKTHAAGPGNGWDVGFRVVMEVKK